MRSILISIKPQWTAKILNGEKTIEIRKTAPKCELPIEVYIYCTKGLGLQKFGNKYFAQKGQYPVRNGKVVAKFTLRKVERFIQGLNNDEYERLPNFALQDYDYYGLEYLMEKACLNDKEINEYAPDLSFYAWLISDLEIFDEPKKLSEFYSLRLDKDVTKLFDNSIQLSNGKWVKRLSNPPQSWCFIEVDRNGK